MGFVDRDKRQEDEELPGSGLHLDLDVKVCPECRRETLPWQTTCPDCGVTAVAPTDLPPRPMPLPHLLDADEDDGGEGEEGG